MSDTKKRKNHVDEKSSQDKRQKPDLDRQLAKPDKLSFIENELYESLHGLPMELVLLVYEYVFSERRTGDSVAIMNVLQDRWLEDAVHGLAFSPREKSVASGMFLKKGSFVEGVLVLRGDTKFNVDTGLFTEHKGKKPGAFYVQADNRHDFPKLEFYSSDEERKVVQDHKCEWRGTKTEGLSVRVGTFRYMLLEGPSCLHVLEPLTIAWAGRFHKGKMQHGTYYAACDLERKGSPFRLFHGNAVEIEGSHTVAIQGMASNMEEGDYAEGTFDTKTGYPIGMFTGRQVHPATKEVALVRGEYAAIRGLGDAIRFMFSGARYFPKTGAVVLHTLSVRVGEQSEEGTTTLTHLSGQARLDAITDLEEHAHTASECSECEEKYSAAIVEGRNFHDAPGYLPMPASPSVVIDLTDG